jgi:hypothetical protein
MDVYPRRSVLRVGRGLCGGLITPPKGSYRLNRIKKPQKGPYVPVRDQRKLNEDMGLQWVVVWVGHIPGVLNALQTGGQICTCLSTRQ